MTVEPMYTSGSGIAVWINMAALLLIVLLLPGPSDEALAQDAGDAAELRLVGEGAYTWFGLAVYDAAYREAQPGCEWRELTITYARGTTARKLVQATREQWQKLGLDDRDRTRPWLRQLLDIWPDIRRGDYLSMRVDAAGAAHFSGVQGELGSIADPDFAAAFLSIWLHPNTSDRDLREDLLRGGSVCRLRRLEGLAAD